MMHLVHNFTILLLLCHIVGDYHLQSETLASAKRQKRQAIWKHLAIQGLLLLAVGIWSLLQGLSIIVLLLLLLVLIGHAGLDFAKYFVQTKWPQQEKVFYLLDQGLHILLILLISEVLFRQTVGGFSFGPIPREVMNWLLLLSLITKPANVSFKILFSKYQYIDPEVNTVPGAGATIGNMERILSVVFLAMNQVAALGLIYTAKSIARFKQIETNRQFAEYYLIGTLYSILYVLLTYLLLSVL